MRPYSLYGVRLNSYWPLPYGEQLNSGCAELELVPGSASFFQSAAGHVRNAHGKTGWFHHARLDDGSTYLAWSGLFEFLVAADGRRIVCRPLSQVHHESFQSYLLGQVLSFALLRRGIEAYLATAVAVDGEAIAFIGDSGYGKSTLGAAFLAAGDRLVTDDVLVLREEGRRFRACPGPPRIKLFPEMAEVLFANRIGGTPMDSRTPKLIFSLEGQQCSPPVPLKAMYVLPRPGAPEDGASIAINRLSRREAFVSLLTNTFNDKLLEPDRLRGQFALNANVASSVPIKSLSYPKRLDALPLVRKAILADLQSETEPAGI